VILLNPGAKKKRRNINMADKKLRIQTLIAKNLSEIIHDLKDDLAPLACVNQVEVNDDFSIAKVYVSHLQKEKVPSLISMLNYNRGFIRSKLAKTLDICKIPDLVFIEDDLYEKGQKIDNIFKAYHEKHDKK